MQKLWVFCRGVARIFQNRGQILSKWGYTTDCQVIFTTCCRLFTLKCSYHQNFYFPIWSYISCNELLQKNFLIWIKSDFFYECLKTWKSYFLAVNPCRWSQHRHAQSCDIDSRMCEFRLDLSRLFYLCKSCFVVHAKCSFPALCMNY